MPANRPAAELDVSIVAYDDAITFVIHGLEWLESTRIMAGQHVIVLAAISGSHTLFSRSLASFDDLNYDSATCIVCEAVIMKYVHCSSCGLEELANLTDNEETGILEITHQEGQGFFEDNRSGQKQQTQILQQCFNELQNVSQQCQCEAMKQVFQDVHQIEGQVGAQQIR
ncbi:2S seed storage protein-like protein, partial [Tanacetum coccineum]